MFKKATLAVLGLAVSSFTTAGSMGPICTPGNVTVPCEAKFWDFSAQALYLKSIFGVEKAQEFGTLPIGKEVKSEWNWGFRLEGSYHFNTGSDISINWMHYRTSVHPTDFLGILSIPALEVFGIPPFPAEFELVGRNRLDQVNVVMGQHTDLSMRDKMRFYAGMQYANIESTSTNDYITPLVTALTDLTFSKFDNTDFKGIGPVVGIDYAYNITEALSLTANGAGSILIGTSRYHAGFIFNPVELIPEQVFFRTKAVVPSVEAKLGLNYSHAMSFGIANIQAGYQIVNYFKVLQAQPLQNLAGFVRPVDYGLFGPYFGLQFVGYA
ncbi:MAG: hypothetical protein HYX60_09905 [Legionella longbeachae]|nr:hypothetical protein [Legionella longbeachae]